MRRALLRLCLALGRTPRELEHTLTSAELTELMAFDLIEPYGQRRTDDGFRLLASLIFSSIKGPDQKPLMPGDFLKIWEPPRPHDPEAEMRQVAAFFERRVAG